MNKKSDFFVKATNVVNATNRHWLLLQTEFGYSQFLSTH